MSETLMPDPRERWHSLPVIRQIMINWLVAKGVHPLTVGSGPNTPLKVAHGNCAADGWFDPDPSGPACFAILIEDKAGPIDLAFWDPRSGATATLLNYGFALGEEQVDNPGVYSFDGFLKVHTDPLAWLRDNRDGIFILDWRRAFDRLRYCPAVAVDASLLATYRVAMQPPHMPNLFVMMDGEAAAA